MPFVVDASALLFATTESSSGALALHERLEKETIHVPHLLDAEIGRALRAKVFRNEVDLDRATDVLSVYPALIDHRYEQFGFLAAMAWDLRQNLTFYDALYVALGAALEVEVVTLDVRIARAPNLPARITIASA